MKATIRRITIDPLASSTHRSAYWQSVVVVGLSTAAAFLLAPYFRPANLVMVYLLGVVIVASRLGRWPSIVTAALSVLSFDFFFIPPVRSFGFSDTQFLLTFAVMVAVALITSDQLSRLRAHAQARGRQALQLEALAAASLVMNATPSVAEVLRVLAGRAREIVGAHQAAAMLAADEHRQSAMQAVSLSDRYAVWRDATVMLEAIDVCRAVRETNRPLRVAAADLHTRAETGAGDAHPPLRGALAVPLVGSDGRNLGLVLLSDKDTGDFTDADEALLVQLAQMASVAIEKDRLYEAADRRRQAAEQLAAMSRDLASVSDVEQVLQTGLHHVSDVFDCELILLLPDRTGRLAISSRYPSRAEEDPEDLATAEWVYAHDQSAGLGTVNFPDGRALHLPLPSSRGTIGVLAVRPEAGQRPFTTEQRHLLETFANRMSLAVERASLAAEAQKAMLRAETERLRNMLLSSISHDLRTPLAAITGAASSLLEGASLLDAAASHELKETIYEEADRLTRLVTNLLDMTRLESGIQAHKEWHALEDVLGAALSRLERRLHGRPLVTHLPEDLPLVPLDDVLIEQVFINLIENAIKYTPPGSALEVSARATDDEVTVEVADQGPGLAPGDEERAFEKFYRGGSAAPGGAGLGLAICRGIVLAHGGRIWAENRLEGGVVFRFILPIDASRQKPETAHA